MRPVASSAYKAGSPLLDSNTGGQTPAELTSPPQPHQIAQMPAFGVCVISGVFGSNQSTVDRDYLIFFLVGCDERSQVATISVPHIRFFANHRWNSPGCGVQEEDAGEGF